MAFAETSPSSVSDGEPLPALRIKTINSPDDFPTGFDRNAFVDFLHTHLGPYADPEPSIHLAIDYAFSPAEGKGGFLLTAFDGDTPVGAAVVNDTGMGGYIPEHILVYLAVASPRRGAGVGTRLLDALTGACTGDVALHVDHDNPARRLYERFGFSSKYAEMRLHRKTHG